MERFTIVARPYLLEDLQQASFEIIELVETYLGTGAVDGLGAPAELFHRIASLRDGAELDQNLLSQASRVLDRLEGAGVSRFGLGWIRSFRRAYSALLEWPELVGGTKLWVPGLLLEQVATDPQLAIRVEHPRAECYTVRIKKSPDIDLFWLASESHWQSFSSPGFSNLLFLQDPEFRSCDFIDLVFGQERYRARYRKLELHESPLGLPRTPYHLHGELAGSFFKEVQLQDRDGQSGAVIRDLNVSAQSDEGEFEGYQTVGWLNPLILGFDVAGDDIPTAESDAEGHRTRETIDLFLDPKLLVHFEPHVGLVDSYRLRLMERLSVRQRVERPIPSVIESLLWGGEGSEPWLPFFLLDTLGGEFIIDNFGRTGKQFPRPHRSENEVRLLWVPPPDASSNGVWLKDYILRANSHLEEDASAVRPGVVLTPADLPGFGSPDGFRKLRIEGAGEFMEPTIVDVIRAAPRSRNLEGATQKALEAMLEVAAELLEDIRFERSEFAAGSQTPYLGEGSYQLLASGLVQFDELSFLDLFSSHYLAPRSPIYVVLPPIEELNACVNVVGSIAHGHKELFRRLLSANLGIEDDGADIWDDETLLEDIVYRYGWWQEWFEKVFDRPRNVIHHFVAEREGFMLSRATLGNSRLGRIHIGNRYDVVTMRV